MDRDQVYLYLCPNFYGNGSEIQKLGDGTDIASMCEDQLKIFQADSVLYAVYISSYTLMELTPFVVVCL